MSTSINGIIWWIDNSVVNWRTEWSSSAVFAVFRTASGWSAPARRSANCEKKLTFHVGAFFHVWLLVLAFAAVWTRVGPRHACLSGSACWASGGSPVPELLLSHRPRRGAARRPRYIRFGAALPSAILTIGNVHATYNIIIFYNKIIIIWNTINYITNIYEQYN